MNRCMIAQKEAREAKKQEKRFQGDFKQGTIYDQIGCVGI